MGKRDRIERRGVRRQFDERQARKQADRMENDGLDQGGDLNIWYEYVAHTDDAPVAESSTPCPYVLTTTWYCCGTTSVHDTLVSWCRCTSRAYSTQHINTSEISNTVQITDRLHGSASSVPGTSFHGADLGSE